LPEIIKNNDTKLPDAYKDYTANKLINTNSKMHNSVTVMKNQKSNQQFGTKSSQRDLHNKTSLFDKI